MKRILILSGICVLCLAVFSSAAEKKPKPGPLTGTWECMSHGSAQGDIPFTLYLQQEKQVVTGSVSAPMGSTEITSGIYKKKKLELRIDTPQGNYVVAGKLKKRQLSGTWTLDNPPENGTWEGKKQVQTSQ